MARMQDREAIRVSRVSDTAHVALREHMKRHGGQLLAVGTWASDEFDRLYAAWTRARWDEGHAWTRDVWKVRP
jgi:hypothetical protein